MNILVVDDMPLNLRLLVSILHEQGFDIRTAIDGRAALEEVARKLPNLILLDIQMPQMNGFEVCETLKSDPRYAAIPIIFLSAADETGSKVRAFELGAVDYITKPFNISEVRLRIQTHISIAQQQQELSRQKAEIETLRDTAALINSTLEFDVVLERILQNVYRVVEHDYANIMLYENGHTRIVGYHGYSEEDLPTVLSARYDKDTYGVFEMAVRRHTVVIGDVQIDPNWDWRWSPKDIRSYLGTPIIADNEVIGFINLDSRQPGFFRPEHGVRLKAFADQVSIAIQNARLYQQAKALAVAEERQRLVRELHDAVSQTLFSAHMTAETLPMLLDKDVELVRRELHQLSILTKAALAEMRTLLIELRPSALLDTDFVLLLTHLVDSIRPRIEGDLILVLDLASEAALSDFTGDIKIQFYRIAQEALNNVVKHARAGLVELTLRCTANLVSLSICDNGIGFNIDTVSQEHMGLRIMRERALNVGAVLHVTSVPQQGTSITIVWDKG